MKNARQVEDRVHRLACVVGQVWDQTQMVLRDCHTGAADGAVKWKLAQIGALLDTARRVAWDARNAVDAEFQMPTPLSADAFDTHRGGDRRRRVGKG